MKSIDLLDSLGSVQDSYILQADAFRRGETKPLPKRLSFHRAALIAAVIALMALLVGCAVAYVLRLQDMKVGEYTYHEDTYTTPEGETVPEQEWTTTLLSLQGYNNSPNQLALQEWLAYQESYDPDGTLLDENNLNESGLPLDYYTTYDCYTWEMKDALDALLEKYDLKKLGEWVPLQRWENQVLFDALQLESLLRPDAQAEVEYLSGYFYPEGTFDFTAYITLTGEDARWTEPMLTSIRYSLTDYFDPVPLSVREIERYEQWHYTLPDGRDILLAMHPEIADSAVMICDQSDAFITVILNTFSDTDPLTKKAVEQFADVLDFSMQPKTADMEQVEALLAQCEEPETLHSYYQGFQISPDGTWYPPEGYSDSFDSYISYVRANAEPENQFYTLMDLNGDGADELLLGNADGQLNEVAYMKEDEVALNFAAYICEENVLEGYSETMAYFPSDDEEPIRNCTAHIYSTLSDIILSLYYLPESDQWILIDENSVHKTITATEARNYIASYPRIELDMKPLSEYPAE